MNALCGVWDMLSIFLSYLASVVISCGIDEWERKWLCTGRAFVVFHCLLLTLYVGVCDMVVTLLFFKTSELPSKYCDLGD